MDLITTQENAAANLPQLEVEIKFYLGQTAQNIIEVGKRLIQAKALVTHGGWLPWLEQNFQLKQRAAQTFMACAERFGNTQTSAYLNQSQMIEMLSLPNEEETEKFIAEKAAEGKAVADMTIKQLREEITQYKATIENERQAHQQSLFDRAREAQKLSEQVTLAKMELGKCISELPKQANNNPTGNNQYRGQIDTPADSSTSNQFKPKSEAIADLGLTQKQAEHYQLMAKNSDAVHAAMAKAREAGDVVSQSQILNEIKQNKKETRQEERRERKTYTPPTELPTDRKFGS